jgi:hypothetical protein
MAVLLGLALHGAPASIHAAEAPAGRPAQEFPGQLPQALRQAWLDARERAVAADRALEDELSRDRKAVECQVLAGFAALLGVADVEDVVLDTDRSTVEAKYILFPSVEQPLRDFILDGTYHRLLSSTWRGMDAYLRHTRVVSRDGTAPDVLTERTLKAMRKLDAARRGADAADERLAAGAARYRPLMADAALAELRFAELDAVRAGTLTPAQYQRLDAAIARGSDEFTWAAHSLRIGRDWVHGDMASPPPIPAFSLRLEGGAQPELRLLYTPGHPGGSLRVVADQADAAARVLEGVVSWRKDWNAIAWFAGRMHPADFQALLREVSPETPGLPNVALTRLPTTGRPLGFRDAVVAAHAGRARSGIDPWFLGGDLKPVARGNARRVRDLLAR